MSELPAEREISRNESRTSAFKLAFQQIVNPKELDELFEDADPEETALDDFSRALVALTLTHEAEIDAEIEPHLQNWTLRRLPRVTLAILRISCAQLMYMREEVPEKVVINEAVNLSRKYGDKEDYAFVNGALRNILNAQADKYEISGN